MPQTKETDNNRRSRRGSGAITLRDVAKLAGVAPITASRVLNTPEIGTIVEGQLADLVLLDANPLDDIRNTRHIRAVIQGGRLVDREALRRAGVR